MFKRRAVEVVNALRQQWPQLEAVYNVEKPRRGAFELMLVTENKPDVLFWSGIKKGPPRKEKFPDLETIQNLLSEVLKSHN